MIRCCPLAHPSSRRLLAIPLRTALVRTKEAAMYRITLVVATCCLCALGYSLEQEDLTKASRKALLRATQFLHEKVSVQGTYLWSYSADLQQRRGELPATATQGWVQPPGTPAVALAFLHAYEATGDRIHLEAARASAYALVDTQLASGGWDYWVDFEPQQHDRWFYRKKVDAGQTNAGGQRSTTTYDDDTTQSALRFLLAMDRTLQGQDPNIRRAIEFGLARLLDAQYDNGAWPQRFQGRLPQVPNPRAQAHFPRDWSRTHPGKGYNYAHFYTLNDRVMETIILTLLQAHELYRNPAYLRAAVRGGEFLLLAQMPEPQPAWAQQYNFAVQPAWARAFEPPAIASAESASAMRALITLYLATGEDRFIQPVFKAAAWLQRSRLPNGAWARFYELQTNRPLYFNKRYQLVYSDNDLPTHYAFRGDFGIPGLLRDLERLQRLGREKYLAQRMRKPSPDELRQRLRSLHGQVRDIIQSQDAAGCWLQNNEIRTSLFIRNIEILAEYLRLARALANTSQ
ncbi:hypothetical protein HRbin36_00004 [bacterium HR36]|nr:hypothetical protein HRbin36_00004 [bacterium HR36]